MYVCSLNSYNISSCSLERVTNNVTKQNAYSTWDFNGGENVDWGLLRGGIALHVFTDVSKERYKVLEHEYKIWFTELCNFGLKWA
jgi:hypothetical protein